MGAAGAGRPLRTHAMRALRHSLLLPAALTAALLLFVAAQARAADPASVVSQVEAANLPATTGNPPAAPASTGTDISAPATPDTTDTSSVDNVQSTVQGTDQSDVPPKSPTPPAPPAPPTPPAPASPPAPPTPPPAPAPVAVANTTTQAVSQVQVSGCLSHCQDVSQTQVASQQNQTVQAVSGAAHSAPASSTSRIKQVQVGCVSACFGTTSKGSTAGLGPHELSELMLALGAANWVPTTPVTAAAQNTVSQTASQLQVGTGDAESQAQGATQANLAIQALGADLTANSTTQAIAQIQIGCLFYCHGTSQQQVATQSNTTVEVAPSAATVSTATASGVVNVTDQLIWQLQIGCLMWCWDATQDQSAASNDVLIGLPAPLPPPPAQPSDPQPLDPGPAAPSDPVPSEPPGATGPPSPPLPSPAPVAPQSGSPPAPGASASAPAGSAIHVGGVVSGSARSGAWSETLSTTGWSITETASPAHGASPAPRRPVPASVGTVSFGQRIARSSTSFAVASTSADRSSRSTPDGHLSHRSSAKPAGPAVIGGGPVGVGGPVGGGVDQVVAIGLAGFALVGLLAGAVAWWRRIG